MVADGRTHKYFSQAKIWEILYSWFSRFERKSKNISKRNGKARGERVVFIVVVYSRCIYIVFNFNLCKILLIKDAQRVVKAMCLYLG